MGKKAGLSAAARSRDLNSLAREFNTHLRETPGNVLTGDLRCAVAQSARDALRDCGGCISLPASAGLKEKSAFRAIASLKHEPEFPSDKPRIREALVTLTHGLVNHQTRFDEEWYQSTIVSLGEAGIVPPHFKERQRQYLIWSLFCEVCLLTVVSHGINIAFLAMDKEPPPLPPSSPTSPTHFDFNKIVRKDRKVRQDGKVSFAPYLMAADVDINSQELSRLTDAGQHAVQSNLNSYSALTAMIFAPEDLAFAEFMGGVYFCDNTLEKSPYKPLDPENRCTDFFNRYDVETIAVAVADAYDSNFCREFHIANKAAAVDTNKSEHREGALTDFAKAATMRPCSMNALSSARDNLRSDYKDETLVEAAGVIGWMEAVTKIADATGKTPIPKNVQAATACLFGCMKICG